MGLFWEIGIFLRIINLIPVPKKTIYLISIPYEKGETYDRSKNDWNWQETVVNYQMKVIFLKHFRC